MAKAQTSKTQKLVSPQLSSLWKEYEEYLEPGNKSTADRTRFPSGVIGLDLALGSVEGITRGIVQIIGDESVGKTTLALRFLAEAQQTKPLVEVELPDGNNYNSVFMDFEHTYDPEYAAALGVDTSKLLVLEMPYAESQFNIVEELLVAGIQFVIIDSIAMVIPKAEEEKDFDDNVKVAGEAGLIGRALKRMNALAYSSDALVLMLNQWRSNMSPMARTEKKPYGARIIKHVITITIELSRVARENERMTIEAFVSKNKKSALGKKVKYEIEHGKGIDIYQDILLQAFDNDLVEKSGTWWYYPTKNEATHKGQGDANAIKNFPMDEIKSILLERLRNEQTSE